MRHVGSMHVQHRGMTGSASTSASELHGRQLLNVTLSGKTPLAQGQEFMDNDDDYP